MRVITNLRESGSESGSAMVGVIFMTMISSMLVLGVLQYSSQEVKNTRKSIDHQKAQNVAEAALQFGKNELIREAKKQRLHETRNNMQDKMDDRVKRLNNLADDFAPDYALHTEDNKYTLDIDAGPVVRNQPIGKGNYADLNGIKQEFTITAGARNPEDGGAAAAYQLKAQVVSINLITFAIFYEGDLEFIPGPTMEVNGPVHTNSDLYLRSRNRLELNKQVRTAGDFIFRGKDGRTPGGDVLIRDDDDNLKSVRYSASDGKTLDSHHPNWTGEALQAWDGRFLSSDHNVQPMRPPVAPLDEMIDLIQRPRSKNSHEYKNLTPEEQDQWQMTEDEKFSNRAAVTIKVDSHGKVTATDFKGKKIKLQTDAELKEVENNPGKYEKDNNGQYKLENDAAVDTSQSFWEDRENRNVEPVDIYMDNLLEQLEGHLDVSSNFSNPRKDRSSGLIYVTRDAPGDGSMPAVRLRNAAEIERENGVSIASDKPVYVEGNFNSEDTKPVMVAGDTVSLLSRNWQDKNSSLGEHNRQAKDTEHHLVVMTGNTPTPTVGGDYGGGVENIYRYLEDWGGQEHTFRGSLICLWESQIADGDWSGSYYSPPDRDWGYDDLYTDTSPPGMVRAFGLEELEWRRIPYEEAKSEFRISMTGEPGGPPDKHPGQGQGPSGNGPPDEHPGQGQGPDGNGPPGAEHWPSPGENTPEYPFTEN